MALMHMFVPAALQCHLCAAGCYDQVACVFQAVPLTNAMECMRAMHYMCKWLVSLARCRVRLASVGPAAAWAGLPARGILSAMLPGVQCMRRCLRASWVTLK